VVHDFRASPKPALAIVQTGPHFLKLRPDGLSNLFRQHSARGRTFRGFAASREIPETHDQQRGEALMQRSARSQRSTLFQAFCQSTVRAAIGKQKVFQNLGRSPLSLRSLRPGARAGTPCCIFEFLPQTFEIGIHGVG
jgi:hypothetical protein